LIKDEFDLHASSKSAALPSFTQVYSRLVNRWFTCEHFYSWIDKPYFQSHSFSRFLEALELQDAKLAWFEWSLVRQSILGQSKRPRRFSAAFIDEERDRLNGYRELFREVMRSIQTKHFDFDGDVSVVPLQRKVPESQVHEVLEIIKRHHLSPLSVG